MLVEAIAIGRRCSDPDIEFEALAYLGGVFIMTDRVEEGLALCDEGLAAACAGELTDLATLDAIFCGFFWACELVNDVPRADQWMRAAAPGTDDAPVAYGPRRTVLDKLLVDAAAEAGAEVREGFTVSSVVFDDAGVIGVRGHSRKGPTVTERARVVVGADGWHSRVAQSVRPDQYHDKARLLCGYYTCYSGLPMGSRFETYVRPDRGFAAWATNDDLTLVVGGWPFAEFEANKKDIEGNFLKMLELAPPFAERIRAAHREARFVGTAVPNFFRKPFGPGWALTP